LDILYTENLDIEKAEHKEKPIDPDRIYDVIQEILNEAFGD